MDDRPGHSRITSQRALQARVDVPPRQHSSFMAIADRTGQFKECVMRAGLPHGRSRRKRSADDAEYHKQSLPEKEYLKEAYNILNHINNLNYLLSGIRKSYLNTDSVGVNPAREPNRMLSLDQYRGDWSNLKNMSNQEREQVDTQAKAIISKCAERVKALEEVENKRSELALKDQNKLLRFVPARLKSVAPSIASAHVAAHHSSITYYLSKRLAEVSQSQRAMQEERIRRQTERSRTLGSGVAQDMLALGLGDPYSDIPVAGSSSKSWLGEASASIASSFASTIGVPRIRTDSLSSYQTDRGVKIATDDELDDDDDFELSSSQIQQFEQENANMLRTAQDTLAAVQQAESRLLDISALQMELIAHLTKQTEITDQLYEDAIATTATVEKGNSQLKEAKRRGKDSRLYILVFLIGSSLTLLFLHYY